MARGERTAAVDVFARLREPDCLADPYPFYAAIQRQPETCTPAGEIVLSRYEDVVGVLNDPRFVKPPMPRAPMKAARVLFRMFLLLNPPDHTRLRRVVAPSFTASAVERLRAKISAVASDLLPSDECTIDLVRDFAYPLPLAVVSEILGIAVDDRPTISAWSATLTTSLDTPPPATVREIPTAITAAVTRKSHPIATVRAANGMVRYAQRQLGKPPSSEFLETLVQGVHDGALNSDEAAATWIMMAIAGHETTANLIGNCVVALLRHPDVLQQVSDGDAQLARAAVEESLRYDSPVPHTPRVASPDVLLHDTHVRHGVQVLLLMAAANRDPDAFPHPDSFDLTRPRTPPHLGFAHGIHFCLGSALARLEGEVALTALLPRLAQHQDLHRIVQRHTVAVRGVESFPITLDAPHT